MEQTRWPFTLATEIPCTVHKYRESRKLSAAGIKRSLVSFGDRKSWRNCRDTFTFDFSYNHLTMRIDERVLRRIGGRGCFQEINHIRKGFPHFTGIYWYACVCVCVCVYIYIFFVPYLFYFFLIFHSHGGRTKIPSQEPFAMDNDNNRVSPIFSPVIHVRSFIKIVAHNFRVIKPCVF